jgi:ABC-2 type transport system ATP-binding protein
MNAIEAERLTKRFRLLNSYRDLLRYPGRQPTKLAVDDMTFTVGRGELFGLLGENGAGKTTLIRMLSTTLLPTSGRAVVAGHDVVEEPHQVRRLIGLVTGDERSFYWRLTGRQNLVFFATLYHLPRREIQPRIDAVLETLGIRQYADRRFNTYSSGTRQKFAIARGLLTDPEVLFLDEPTRSLDPMAADDLRRYIADHIVGELGRTVLLATHTLGEAESICSRVGIVRHGRLVAIGSMDELRARTKLSSVLDMVLDGIPPELVTGIDGVGGVQRVSTGSPLDGVSLRVEFDGGDGTLDAVLRLVIGCGARVRSFVTRSPTLEEIYRAVHADEADTADDMAS